MRLCICLFVLGLLAGLGAFPAQAQLHKAKPAPKPAVEAPPSSEVDRLLRQAQELQARYKESEALATYEEVLGRTPATYEALWQAAVLSVRIGARYTDETRKAAYFAAAHLYANRALVVRPDGAEGHYAEALSLANQATLLSARGRLLAYREMKPHVQAAVAARPTWADAWQLLGRWHYRVDHYNLLERVFSRVLLGGTPSGASTRQALEALGRAHELAPQRIQFAYDLARVHLNQGQRRQAISVLQEAVTMEPVTADELELSRRCRRLLEQQNRHLRRQIARRVKTL
ncbi:tetratricopeptide repeat protein [Hymenobacter weizhouensis]|uniref:tetratricopeptide repeat protein n=1 Tax=Hymenobacter sp. YIM 151500-1 TaxID=2987689 RepID=UPI0022264082|nr:tetratricopeptide repeat protein [Hymenobacter sp. YIM 151500-1]UYZ64146.1 tetratricopeptide repeat protein [Hymenobacter sp. YIM 151500-1]